MEIIKFGAKWCATCKTIDSQIEKWDQRIKDSITKVDFDQNVDLAKKYGVRGLPTVIVVDGDVEVVRFAGSNITEAALIQYV